MRDKIKDIEYFNTFINEDLARVKKFSDKLELRFHVFQGI